MNFHEANERLSLGQQIRITTPYGAFPISIPAGATGTVIGVDLAGYVNPRIMVAMDETHAHLWHGNVLQIRGPEEAYHMELEKIVGRWADPVPFEIVAEPTTSVEMRRQALLAERKRVDDERTIASMSDDFYASNGTMDAFMRRIRILDAAVKSLVA